MQTRRMEGDESNVRVGVRVRPLLPREVAESARQCLTHPHTDSVMIGKASHAAAVVLRSLSPSLLSPPPVDIPQY